MGDTINVPVNGKAPVDVLMQDPPAGPYLVEINQIVTHTKKKPGENDSLSLEATVTVAEGDATGMQTRIYIGQDWTKAFNVGHFVNLFTGIMENLGKTETEIKAKLAGNVQMDLGNFTGKKAFIYVKAVPDGATDNQGRPQLADKNFITRTQYEAAKKAMAIAGPVVSRKAGATAAGGTPPAPPAGTTVNGATGTPTPTPPPPGGTPTASPGVGDLFT